MLKKIAGASLMALSLSNSGLAQEMVYPDTLVVLDVSNSMWGQIDGVSKIEIARGVIGDLLGDLETESEFGLIAYGHRETSSCTDIELVLPVGPLNGAEFSAAVDRLQPRGRTPLTAALKMAADTLNSQTRSARIILLTDGLESCEADPCALAAELEASGLDFTTHVIGFGVSDIEDQSQIRCIAENTGGFYLTADTADELTSALEFMAMPIAQPQINLRAIDQSGNLLDNPNIVWSIFNLTDQEMWLRDKEGASVSVEYQADDYRAIAQLNGTSATLEFTFDGQETMTFDVVFDNPVPNAVTLTAPKSTPPGVAFEIMWIGPENSGDYLAIAKPEGAITDFSDYARASAGSPAILTAPDETGPYEIRYISPTTNEVLATKMLVVGEVEISLNSPEQVKTTSNFMVTWEGALFENDQLVLIPSGAPSDEIIASLPTSETRSAVFTAPEFAGEFEVQYRDGDGSILASSALRVEFFATLSAVSETVAGADITLSWTGPDFDGDFVTIVPAEAASDVFGNLEFTSDGDQLKIVTPDVPGSYEIRYVTGDTQTVLSYLPILLLKPDASITAVTEAISGAEIEISWTGPDNQNDFLTIVPSNARDGASDNSYFTRQSSPITVQLPVEPGGYEIRYITGQSRLTLATSPLKITTEPTTLSAEPEIIVGRDVVVSWQGPESHDDLITIVHADSADTVIGKFVFTSEGPILVLPAENSIGPYELRYISGVTGDILARLTINIIVPPIVVEAPLNATAGATIVVDWIGPDNAGDYVTIVPAGTDESEYGNYSYTRNGDPLDLLTTDVAGDYEIRYISGETRATLASTKITLDAATASIEATAEAIAGSEIVVNWLGPDNLNDFITIVPVDTQSGEYGNYTYSRRGPELRVISPDVPGEYEIRYVSGQSFRTLSFSPIILTAPQITIDASPVGFAGTYLEVFWTGPSNKNDFLTIAPVGAEHSALGAYQYTRKGNPLELMLPDDAGQFEIRYVSGQSMRVLLSLPLTILAQ